MARFGDWTRLPATIFFSTSTIILFNSVGFYSNFSADTHKLNIGIALPNKSQVISHGSNYTIWWLNNYHPIANTFDAFQMSKGVFEAKFTLCRHLEAAKIWICSRWPGLRKMWVLPTDLIIFHLKMPTINWLRSVQIFMYGVCFRTNRIWQDLHNDGTTGTSMTSFIHE